MTKTVKLDKNATAFDALVKVADYIGDDRGYVTAINGLAQKEHGKNSGWMYSVNGTSPNVTAGNYTLKDGDVVLWHYVNATN